MNLRDEIENRIREWDAHEIARGAAPIVDYDCSPPTTQAQPAESRLTVYRQLSRLLELAGDRGDYRLAWEIRAHQAYLRELLGQHTPLDEYVRATQGCPAAGWPDEYVAERGEIARARLASRGIAWGPATERELDQAEGVIDADDAAQAIRDAADELEPRVRAVTGASARFSLDIVAVDEDAYWSYWLDGAGEQIRLRINLRRARFTRVRVRQFALHEVLGHALSCACYASGSRADSVPWVRTLSVHALHPVASEGLAQALPLFATPEDDELITRVRLDHYLQLVRGELHIAVNAGASVEECAAHARSRVPFWNDATIADALTDRGSNVLLRSYLWSYPAGLDWFAALADSRATVTPDVLHAAYREPLTPDDLAALWPAGPPIGGTGGPVRLREPAVP
jgi:hypothetical protein